MMTAKRSGNDSLDASTAGGKKPSLLSKTSMPPEYSASGRPIRRVVKKCPAVEADNPRADEDEDYSPTGDMTTKKRKRTPLPDSKPDRHVAAQSLITPASCPSSPRLETVTPPRQSSRAPISLTFNIPLGFHGPLTVNIDANDLLAHKSPASGVDLSQGPSSTPRGGMASKMSAKPGPMSMGPTSKSEAGKTGFLDLPPEIRNQIYRFIFVKDQPRLNFGSPSNFQRSSAVIRACKQLAHEGAGILYSECEFYFRRNNSSRTPPWSTDSREVGFADVHRFLDMIGSANVSRIRHLFFLLEDAVPCLNPQFKTAEQRRYVHDEHLRAAIRIIADHGRLQTLKLGFFGRRNVGESDSNFLREIKGIKADSVEVLARRCHPDWPRFYSNLQWPKIFFRLALEVKTAVTRKRKFYPPLKGSKKDFFDDDSDEETREAVLCPDCGDIHV